MEGGGVKGGTKSVLLKERHQNWSYSFSLTWKPPSYMVHGLVSAHLEVTKGVRRHILWGAVCLGHPI